MSVDVEDYFQVSAFEHRVTRQQWDQYDSRVVVNTHRMLQLFEDAHVQGTFFVLGWVADRFPGLLRSIARAGHEIASHGYWHRLVYELTPEEFEADVQSAQDAIAKACGVTPRAYRAPSFSIVGRSMWALDILRGAGIEVDSSIFPISGHDRYGVSDAQHELHSLPTATGDITEFPPSVIKVRGIQVPVGGGYFRLFPRRVTSRAIRGIEQQSRPAMFYIHPWEIDPDQPKIRGLGYPTRFRHYVNLRSTAAKLVALCQAHRFGTLSDAMASVGASPATTAVQFGTVASGSSVA